MITRIVKMTYREAHISEFKEIFKVSSQHIKASEGCHSLRMLQDESDPSDHPTHRSLW